ncbi:MAG: CRTAC1 family protein, partial [Acidobacteriaceae bacterium]|nr:CRTAC1 family protein [Acidobacteriaceae bacterium]
MTAAAFLPAGGFGSAVRSGTGMDFHLHPHYREQTPLEAVLRKKDAALDNFAVEKYHDQIAAILNAWSRDLLTSPRDMRSVRNMLAGNFQGPSLRPSESKLLRSQGVIEVRQLSFDNRSVLMRDAFATEFQSYFEAFSQIVTAQFEITGIEERDGGQLGTQVRYEFIGTGHAFFREQRTGAWQILWQAGNRGEYLVAGWRHAGEVCSRSMSAVYMDATKSVLGANRSYSEQLLHGTDYWRTVIDGASHIDIYGHNGVCFSDIDGDGFDDLYVCQPAGLPNRLYRNRGDGTFEDVTEASGLGVLGNTSCAIFADFDNDGHQDAIVVRANGPLLFLNDGKGRFREKPDAFQFASAPQGTFTGAAAADYDRDGWLDIYFCLYVYYQGTDQYKYPTPYFDANNGPPNFLMHNNRNGTFHDATAESGLNQNNTRFSFCCGWTDTHRDGRPDLYVVNDFGRKNLYRNNGDGTFTDVAKNAQVEDVGAGMSICPFDYDNDGFEDLYVADMWTAAGERIATQKSFKENAPSSVRALYRKHAMGNSLFRNAGSGIFEDRTRAAGVGMGRWSWSSDTWDFDHDGFVDLYIANGMISGPLREDLNSFFWRQVVAKSPDEAKPEHDYEQGWNAINELIRSDYSWSGFERNVFYANNRDGTFSDVSGAMGLDFLEDGRSFALADIDHDGRLEVVLKNRNAPQLRILKNVVTDLPSSISFRLQGTKSNRDAIGSAITIETDLGRQTRMLQAGSGFLAQHSKEILFGLGE